MTAPPPSPRGLPSHYTTSRLVINRRHFGPRDEVPLVRIAGVVDVLSYRRRPSPKDSRILQDPSLVRDERRGYMENIYSLGTLYRTAEQPFRTYFGRKTALKL